MKVPCIEELTKLIISYREQTGKHILILVDTTFAPASKVLEKIKAVSTDVPAMVFISLSKSVSRGLTTAGCIVAGEHSYT